MYDYTHIGICLKYVPAPKSYPEAVISCLTDGGDLIKLDSIEKYNIFRNHSAQYTDSSSIQIWVQGVKTGSEWRFHDGSLMPEILTISETNGAGEIHIRSRSADDFTFRDAGPLSNFHYMCEIYRIFSCL
ncbi:uncharacterized protein LOC133198681 [Saccostrea echinata]|uniref:uncharacterized protein LOC133198681 n=1 Tax=Saccostrea echinata TaxID=191078 RepID=UPI002A7F9E83|nr:uncharacterized protein LOC133198681 [Saccostrea echinata]